MQERYATYFEEFLNFEDNCPRIDSKVVNVDVFVHNYEQTSRPVVITGLQDDWRANKKWTIDRIAKKYRNQQFKCGEDNKGYNVKIKMKYYVEYMQSTMDDSPLYIFDSNFGEVIHLFINFFTSEVFTRLIRLKN